MHPRKLVADLRQTGTVFNELNRSNQSQRPDALWSIATGGFDHLWAAESLYLMGERKHGIPTHSKQGARIRPKMPGQRGQALQVPGTLYLSQQVQAGSNTYLMD